MTTGQGAVVPCLRVECRSSPRALRAEDAKDAETSSDAAASRPSNGRRHDATIATPRKPLCALCVPCADIFWQRKDGSRGGAEGVSECGVVVVLPLTSAVFDSAPHEPTPRMIHAKARRREGAKGYRQAIPVARSTDAGNRKGRYRVRNPLLASAPSRESNASNGTAVTAPSASPRLRVNQSSRS